MELFLATREAEGLQPTTLTCYRTACERFLREIGPNVDRLTDSHVARFITELRRKELKPASIHWYQVHTYVWLGWMFEHGYLERDIRKAVRPVRVPQVKHRTLGPELYARVLTTAADRRHLATGKLANPQHYYRNIALLRLLWATGLRRSEIVGVDLEDVDFRSSRMLVRHTKAQRERRVPFDAPAKVALLEYLARERGREDGPLFIATGGVRMTPDALAQVLKDLSARLGAQVSSHDFRRGFASRVRRAGLDIGHTMKLLGHTSPTMTLLYSQEGEEAAAIAAYRERVG